MSSNVSYHPTGFSSPSILVAEAPHIHFKPLSQMEDDDTGNRLRISRRPSAANLRKGRHHRRRLSASSARQADADEHASLLDSADLEDSYATIPGTPRPRLSRNQSSTSPRTVTASSFTSRLSKSLAAAESNLGQPWADERVWYDQVSSACDIYIVLQNTDMLHSLHLQV